VSTLTFGCTPSTAKIGNKTEDLETNSLVVDWSGPYQGVPAFEKSTEGALKPSLRTGI